MKCKTYVDEQGTEVQELDGTPEEMREYFGRKTTKYMPIPGSKSAKYWTPTEDQLLLKLVKKDGGNPSQFTFVGLAVEFDNRTWKSLENRYYKLKGKKKSVTNYWKGKSKVKAVQVVKVKKVRSKYKPWSAQSDADVKEFVEDPDNYFKTGYIKKSKLQTFATGIGRTTLAVRARMDTLDVGSLKQVKVMLRKYKKSRLIGLQTSADKLKEDKTVTEIRQSLKEKEINNFPSLENAKVHKESYQNTFKYFTSTKGNKIAIKEAFPLFGVDNVDGWSALLSEIMTKSDLISKALSVDNLFSMVSTDAGRVLQYGG